MQVALGIGGGECGLAQHVVGVAKALGLEGGGVAQGLGNGFARHELLTHHAHGHVHAFADQGLAATRGQPPQGGPQAAFTVGGDQLAGQQQAPGGRIDEQRRAFAQVACPFAMGDLVADQGIAGGGIGDAQQGLGEAHQGHPLLRRQCVLLQQALHQAGPATGTLALAQVARQALGQLLGGAGQGLGQAGLLEQLWHHLGLGPAPGRGDGRPQRAGRQQTWREGLEGDAGVGISAEGRTDRHGEAP